MHNDLCLFNVVCSMLRLVLNELCRHPDGPGLGKLDGGPDGGRVLEHHVDLLKVAAHRLRVEQVDADGDAEADDAKYDIVLPSDGVNRNWSYHDDDKVPFVPVRTNFMYTEQDS